jgi:predicted metal-dependent enzyme (double-stranded beta helix superfamily)
MGVLVFVAETFVRECRSAASALDPVGAVQVVVEAAISDGASIDAALGTERQRENDTLFSSRMLTVQRILWPGGVGSSPHEHRMWAVIGVYRGEELNHLFERTPDGLKEYDERVVRRREALALDANVIHSVENPHRELTAGLHVYGGDILGADRSAWGPDGCEVPFPENNAAYIAMFAPLRDMAQEHGEQDDDARYHAIVALTAATKREKRYLTHDECRRIIAAAWGLPQ